MQLSTVSLSCLPRNQVPLDEKCHVCLSNINNDEGQDWAAHRDNSNTKFMHFIHKDCTLQAHKVSKLCLLKDVNLDLDGLITPKEIVGAVLIQSANFIGALSGLAFVIAALSGVSVIICGAAIVGTVAIPIELIAKAAMRKPQEALLGFVIGGVLSTVELGILNSAVDEVGVGIIGTGMVVGGFYNAMQTIEVIENKLGMGIFDIGNDTAKKIINFPGSAMTYFVHKFIGQC